MSPPTDQNSRDSEPTVDVEPCLDFGDAAAAPNHRPQNRVGQTFVDRYLIKHQIGEGGAGVVYRAYDIELNRDVALKFVRAAITTGGESLGNAQARLFREAQAAAQLAHPNVVAVYDVGVSDDDVFIAMEFVEGVDLRRKLTELGPLPWREVLALFIAAGRGLAAAHAANLVHRDFKPANVLVGEDGRVRVVDFGLAKRTKSVEIPSVRSPSRDAETSVETSITGESTVVGTPGYMAPEQFRPGPVDAAADQYGFCVSLYFGLAGIRPFAKRNALLLGDCDAAQELQPPLPGHAVPRWLLRLIVRGLSAEPTRRWPSMNVLLRRLEKGARPRRSKWVVSAGIATATGVASFVAIPSVPADRCNDVSRLLGGVWDEDTRREVAARFNTSSWAQANRTWVQAEALIDASVREWTSARAAACAQDSSGPLFDARLACLDDHKRELAALTTIWRHADTRTIARGATAAAALGDASNCMDDGQLDSQLANVSRVANTDPIAAEQLREGLALAKAWIANGEYKQAVDILRPLLAQAEALGHEPLAAQILVAYGHAQTDPPLHETLLTRGYFLSADLGSYPDAFASAADLASLVGTEQADTEAGEQWLRHAHSALQAGELGPVSGARLESARGDVHHTAGRADEAVAAYRRAIVLLEGSSTAHANALALAEAQLSAVLGERGKHQEAENVARIALARLEESVGSDHPWLSIPLYSLSAALASQQEFDEAIRLAKRRIALLKAVDDDESPQALGDLATIYVRARKPELALEVTLRAKAILEGDPETPPIDLAELYTKLGQIESHLQHWDQELHWMERAVRLLEELLDPEHPWLAGVQFQVAAALSHVGRHEEAYMRAVKVLPTLEKHLGSNHGDFASGLMQIGLMATATQRFDDARQHLERALEITLSQKMAPGAVASVQQALGNTLWHWEDERPRARTLALAALQTERTLAPNGKSTQVTLLLEWLDLHVVSNAD